MLYWPAETQIRQYIKTVWDDSLKTWSLCVSAANSAGSALINTQSPSSNFFGDWYWLSLIIDNYGNFIGLLLFHTDKNAPPPTPAPASPCSPFPPKFCSISGKVRFVYPLLRLGNICGFPKLSWLWWLRFFCKMHYMVRFYLLIGTKFHRVNSIAN